jgi:hypothetical protein
MRIVGLAGNMGAGKTTVANWLVENYGYTKVSLATPLKQIANLMRMDETLYEGIRLANSVMGLSPIGSFDLEGELGESRQYLENINGLYSQSKQREFLQFLGTDVMRANSPDCFAIYLLNKIGYLHYRKGITNFVVDDVRFLNEAGKIMDISYSKLITLQISEEKQRERIEILGGDHTSEKEIELIAGRYPNSVVNADRPLEKVLLAVKEKLVL